MTRARTLAWALASCAGFWCANNGLAQTGLQKDSFRVYTLNTDGGDGSVAFSPDDRFVAVLASKYSVNTQKTQADVTVKLQLWDFRKGALASEKILSHQLLPTVAGSAPDTGNYLDTYARSGSTIIVCFNGHLMVLDSRTLEETQDIDLYMTDWPKFPQNGSARSYVRNVTVDKNADRAAVLLLWGPGSGGELRVYDLKSGALLRKWDYSSLRQNDHDSPSFGGADISPDGRRVAVSLLRDGEMYTWFPSRDRNVFVLDVDSGGIVTAFFAGYPAGEICFAPTAPLTLLTVSGANFPALRSRHETIRVWDPTTGKLLRELACPPEGVHYQVQLSSDGKVVLGYTGLEKSEFHWWLGEEEIEWTAYDKFGLWNLRTGQLIASGPEVPGSFSSPRLEYQLSPKGDVVLLYPESASGGGPLTFYELQSTP